MRIVAFEKRFDRSSFGCGNAELDRYLKERISQDRKRSLTACFVLAGDEGEEVMGYHTLSAYGIGLTEIAAGERKRLPSYPQIPATLLGRLAVDKRLRGQGWGARLLADALKRAWKNREAIGSWAVVVEAIDHSAVEFYRHFGFEPVEGKAERLFLPMKEIGKLF